MKKIIAIIAVSVFISLFFINKDTAYAAVSSGSVVCNAPSDCLAGVTGVQYNVSFATTDASPASQIYVTFPSGYNFGGFVPIVSSVSVGGTVASTTSFTMSAPTTVEVILTTPSNLSTGTVTFTISSAYLTTPSVNGTTGNFGITTNASGEVAQTNIAGVTITGATTPPIMIAPTSGQSYSDGNMFTVEYTLPQTPQSGSTTLTFAPISGSPIVLTLSNAQSGVQTFVTFSLTNGFSATPQIVSSTASTIPDGTYSITLAYQGAGASVAASTTVSNVTIAPVTPPVVSTVSPLTEIGQTTATLKGLLTFGGGTVVTTGFRYGTNPDPSSYAYFPYLDENYEGTPILFIGPVTGLSCGTTYYYQAYAMNTAAIETGDFKTFQTSACTVTSSGVSGGNSNITWTPQTGFVTHAQTPSVIPITIQASAGSAAPVIPITMTLKYGMNNAQVKLLQEYLNAHGFVVATKGRGSAGHENTSFGLATKNAVMAFEKKHGLKADGIVDAKMRALL